MQSLTEKGKDETKAAIDFLFEYQQKEDERFRAADERLAEMSKMQESECVDV